MKAIRLFRSLVSMSRALNLGILQSRGCHRQLRYRRSDLPFSAHRNPGSANEQFVYNGYVSSYTQLPVNRSHPGDNIGSPFPFVEFQGKVRSKTKNDDMTNNVRRMRPVTLGRPRTLTRRTLPPVLRHLRFRTTIDGTVGQHSMVITLRDSRSVFFLFVTEPGLRTGILIIYSSKLRQ